MAARRWRTTYMHPIVAPPAKQALIDTTAMTAAGMGDMVVDGRLRATSRYAAQHGISNPKTTTRKPRVEIVMKVTITPMKTPVGPTRRLRTWRGWPPPSMFVASVSCVHWAPFHAGESPLEEKSPMGTAATPKAAQRARRQNCPRWRALRRSFIRCARTCETTKSSWNGQVSTPNIVRQGSTSTMRQTEMARQDIIATRHLKPLWYIVSRKSASLLSVQRETLSSPTVVSVLLRQGKHSVSSPDQPPDPPRLDPTSTISSS
eukprot:scaffold68775_cov32-Phaeocystis_antarctica.AAC.2